MTEPSETKPFSAARSWAVLRPVTESDPSPSRSSMMGLDVRVVRQIKPSMAGAYFSSWYFKASPM
ncbi:hypothetical protein D3C87_851400 [compost metagenome]